jgi:F-type H+-transporting ATPase subunit delta
MAEALTIARPYAEAVLQFALATKSVDQWSKQLAFLAAVAADAQTVRFIKNPRATSEQKIALFADLAGATLNDSSRNFLRLLEEYHRLLILPEIAQEYERLVAQQQQHLTAVVRTAQPLSEAQLGKMIVALEKRFHCTVSVETQMDESLLGGALIEVGDLQIRA